MRERKLQKIDLLKVKQKNVRHIPFEPCDALFGGQICTGIKIIKLLKKRTELNIMIYTVILNRFLKIKQESSGIQKQCFDANSKVVEKLLEEFIKNNIKIYYKY